MHCPTIPEEKNHYKKSSDSSDGQSKAGSDVDNLDSKEHGKRPLKTELFPGSNATFRILEVGCGAGNSVFPILNTLQAAQCCAFVHDVCDDGLPYPFPDGILDVILLVFVLSSIHPDRVSQRLSSIKWRPELSTKPSERAKLLSQYQCWCCFLLLLKVKYRALDFTVQCGVIKCGDEEGTIAKEDMAQHSMVSSEGALPGHRADTVWESKDSCQLQKVYPCGCYDHI
ncbi:hypothetical protein CB1_001160004 [Camelus ferus]|nr:hypothetical protein CB1_001160004 [Camelus ferus]